MKKMLLVLTVLIAGSFTTQFYADAMPVLDFSSVASNVDVLSLISNHKNTCEQVYTAVDIEADGPSPLNGNMINLRVVATDLNLTVLGYFEANIEPYMEAHPQTMNEFWSENKEEYERTKVKAVDPKTAMNEYLIWMEAVSNGKTISPMMLPAGFDKMFTQAYTTTFANKSPLSFDSIGAIDILTLIMAYKATTHYDVMDFMTDLPETMKQPGLNFSHNRLKFTLRQMVVGVNLLRHFNTLPAIHLDESTVLALFELSDNHFGKISKE